MNRPRPTTRRMMIAVALACPLLGLIAWDLRLQGLSREYRRQAWRMSRIEETNRLAEAHLRKQSESDELLEIATRKAMASREGR